MRIRLFLLSCLLLSCFLSLRISPVSAQDDDVAQILGRINALRQQNGLLPLDLNSQLTAAAQGHSDDMARTGNIDHTGSDGSSIEARIRASGYGHWRGFGIWGENIYGGQMADVDAAWNFWINSQVHRSNLLNQRYREIGIGVGHSDKGTYYTLNFGAQPNVLPFFVTGDAPIVTLLLTNENDIVTGEGVAIMGQATQVRIAEGTDTTSAGWLPWAASIPFQLSTTPGQKTITVEYKDALGRGTKFSRTINVSELSANTPTAMPTMTIAATATAKPSITSTIKATTTNTFTPTATGTTQPTATATPSPTETYTPLPTNTPQPTNTSTAQPTRPPTTAAPTVTPASLPSPTRTPQLLVANLATYPAGSRLTPPAPLPAPTERPLFAFQDTSGSNTFAVLIGLQAIVLIAIGAVAVARIRRRS